MDAHLHLAPKLSSENVPVAANGGPLNRDSLREKERAAKLAAEPLDPGLQHASPSPAP